MFMGGVQVKGEGGSNVGEMSVLSVGKLGKDFCPNSGWISFPNK